MSPHFTYEELTFSQTALRKRIDNTPNDEARDNLHTLAYGLEEVRALLGAPMNISSGYRSPKLNAAVGGAKHSAHMKGLAADFIAPRFGTPAGIVAEIKASSINFDQCIVEFGRWVHFAVPPAGEKGRRQAFAIGSTAHA